MKHLIINKNNLAVLDAVDTTTRKLPAAMCYIEVEDSVASEYLAARRDGAVRFVDGVLVVPKAKAPLMVSAAQLLLALLADGITEAMLVAAIEQIPDQTQREAARIEFQRREMFSREHPVVLSLAAVFGYETSQKLEALFLRASKL